MKKSEVIAAKLLESEDPEDDLFDGYPEDEEDVKDWLIRTTGGPKPAEQIWGDFGDPWTYGGAWKDPGNGNILVIRGLEGSGIDEIDPDNVQIPSLVFKSIVDEIEGLPEGVESQEDLTALEDVTDPEDHGSYLYIDEVREAEAALEEWRIKEAERLTELQEQPVYEFIDEEADWIDGELEERVADYHGNPEGPLSNAQKLLMYGEYAGFEELDSHPWGFTKSALSKRLNIKL